jgi:gamma-glutamyltranspeptidase / glutathione hydrolase
LIPLLAKLDRRDFLVVAGGALTGLAACQSIAAQSSAKGHGLVVGYPESAKAGMDVLANGGNAIDAIVAGALVAGVTAVTRCGIGGYGGHMTIGLPGGSAKTAAAKRDSPIFSSEQEKIGTVPGREKIGTVPAKIVSIDFNSEAPAAARADMFPLDEKGGVKGKINWHGWLAAGVPATLAGLQLALDKYGTRPFAQLVQPAIRYAREGIAVYWPWAGAEESFKRDSGSAKLFFRNGKLLAKGETYCNPDLADMLQKLAEKGSVEDFYRGQIGRQIADAFKKNGGLVTADDMANYRPLEVEPLQIDWHGHVIATAPLTAGGLSILQTIAALKALGPDWDRLAKDNPKRIHAWIEALRISWDDRLRLFGDPQHVDVPVERLLSENYARESAKKIQSALAQKRPVPASTDGRAAGGTLNLAAMDANGMMACLTMTHGDPFGAQVTVDGLGLILGHGMSRFDPVPRRPNSVAPGKRPLDNMCPTIVLRDGKPAFAIGAVGGRRIPNAVFQVLLNLIDAGRNLEDAVADPRIHTEGGLTIHIEQGRPEAEINYLKKVGYQVAGAQMSWVAGIDRDSAAKGSAVGVADDRPVDGKGMRNPRPLVTRGT